MIRAVSWTAVSSLPQAKKISLDDQLAENRRHVERHGATLIAELVVPGESRSIILFEDACRRIEAYAQLRDLLDRKAFDVLVYLDRSRLGRKAALSMAVISLCEEAGVLCYETENPPASMEQRTATYDDMLLGAIKSVGAQREVQKIQQRHRFGMAERARRGLFARGAPYGWNEVYDSKGEFVRYEIDETAAAAVRYAFLDCYLHRGLAYGDIAAELNLRGYTAPSGGAWTPGAVRGLFRRIGAYRGRNEFNKRSATGRALIDAPGIWPPILTEEEAGLITAERARRVPWRRRPVEPALFGGGVLVCDHCERGYVIVMRRERRDGQTSITYRCPGRCPHSYIHDLKVIDLLRADIMRLGCAQVRAAIVAATPSRTVSLGDELAALASQLEAVMAKRARLTNAYVNLAVLGDEEYQIQMRALEHARVTLEEEQRRLTAAKSAAHEDERLGERLLEIATGGQAVLAEKDTRTANAWMLRHYRIYVCNNDVVYIRYR